MKKPDKTFVRNMHVYHFKFSQFKYKKPRLGKYVSHPGYTGEEKYGLLLYIFTG